MPTDVVEQTKRSKRKQGRRENNTNQILRTYEVATGTSYGSHASGCHPKFKVKVKVSDKPATLSTTPPPPPPSHLDNNPYDQFFRLARQNRFPFTDKTSVLGYCSSIIDCLCWKEWEESATERKKESKKAPSQQTRQSNTTTSAPPNNCNPNNESISKSRYHDT